MLVESLHSYMASYYPILYLTTFEEEEADRLIQSLADRDEDRKEIYEWNMAQGIVDFKTKSNKRDHCDLASALDGWLRDYLTGHILVIKDAHLALRESPIAVARLKALALKLIRDQEIDETANEGISKEDRVEPTIATIVLVSSQQYIPPELEKFITLFDLPLPDSNAIRELIQESADYYGGIAESDLDELTLAFRGLSKHEIQHLLQRAVQKDMFISAKHVALVVSEKEQIIKKSGVVEMVAVKERLEDIGGLRNLKKWLEGTSKNPLNPTQM